jgi:hypothetical protein
LWSGKPHESCLVPRAWSRVIALLSKRDSNRSTIAQRRGTPGWVDQPRAEAAQTSTRGNCQPERSLSTRSPGSAATNTPHRAELVHLDVRSSAEFSTAEIGTSTAAPPQTWTGATSTLRAPQTLGSATAENRPPWRRTRPAPEGQNSPVGRSGDAEHARMPLSRHDNSFPSTHPVTRRSPRAGSYCGSAPRRTRTPPHTIRPALVPRPGCRPVAPNSRLRMPPQTPGLPRCRASCLRSCREVCTRWNRDHAVGSRTLPDRAPRNSVRVRRTAGSR